MKTLVLPYPETELVRIIGGWCPYTGFLQPDPQFELVDLMRYGDFLYHITVEHRANIYRIHSEISSWRALNGND